MPPINLSYHQHKTRTSQATVNQILVTPSLVELTHKVNKTTNTCAYRVPVKCIYVTHVQKTCWEKMKIHVYTIICYIETHLKTYKCSLKVLVGTHYHKTFQCHQKFPKKTVLPPTCVGMPKEMGSVTPNLENRGSFGGSCCFLFGRIDGKEMFFFRDFVADSFG